VLCGNGVSGASVFGFSLPEDGADSGMDGRSFGCGDDGDVGTGAGAGFAVGD
jgi:hypothetical protein